MEKVLRKSLICLGMLLFASFSYGQNDYIYGNVIYHNNVPMDGVLAELVDSTGATYATTTTNSAGFYEFTNVPAGNYTVVFSTTEPAGGITLTDAYLVMLHLWNLYPFNDFQAEVADVNNNGLVDWADYIQIMVGYLNQGIPFSEEWVFETRDVTLSGSREGWTSLGSSTGDVNGTFIPPKFGNCFLNEELSDIVEIDLNESIHLGLATPESMLITGMHIAFEIPQGLSVEGVNSVLPGVSMHQEGQVVRITWMNGEPEPLVIGASSSVVELLVVSNSYTQAGEEQHISLTSESHFIGEDGEMLPFVRLDLPGVKFMDSQEVTIREQLYPNPFISYANLEYELPTDGQVRIIIFNSNGQLINVLTDEYQEAGPHNLKIDGSELPAGTYHYAIQFNDRNKTFKSGSMIKSK